MTVEYTCCAATHRTPTNVAPWLCPTCLGQVPGSSSTLPATLALAEAFSLQQQAWARKERRFALPELPISKERLNLLLEKGAAVEGEVDLETGRFYLRQIRCASGTLFLGVQEGNACIYQIEDNANEPG